MPWEDKTVEKLREEFVNSSKNCTNFSSLCREFGITRKTGYKWIEREKLNVGFKDLSRSPKTLPTKTSVETEQAILSLRKENPGWGARTLRKVLENEGFSVLPCERTVNNILNRNGCISIEESQKRQKYIRFQKENCNDMWQVDFKGDFKMNDGNRCYPLDILDDCSRYLIKIVPSTHTRNVVIPAFEAAFKEYGLPLSVLSDNGEQFSGLRMGYTHFEKWLMCLDVLPIHGRIRHPQTQGKIERFHRTLHTELLTHTPFSDIIDADNKLQLWREKYNNVRPHEALNMLTPSEVYVKSNREYTDSIKPYEYSGEFPLLKVNAKGYISIDKQRLYFSDTFIGEYIEFRPNPLGDSFFACFRNFKIAEFDSISGNRINRSISRL